TAGQQRALRNRAVRTRHRPAKVGPRAREARRKECQEAGGGSGGAEARGALAPAVGDRRGVRAHGLPRAPARDSRGLKRAVRSSSRTSSGSSRLPKVETSKAAPSGRLRSLLRVFELGVQMSAPVRVGPQHAPGRDGGPSSSANESRAVRCFEIRKTGSTRK